MKTLLANTSVEEDFGGEPFGAKDLAAKAKPLLSPPTKPSAANSSKTLLANPSFEEHFGVNFPSYLPRVMILDYLKGSIFLLITYFSI